MFNIIDEKTKEFIDSELSKINSDKERVTEEKRRIRNEMNEQYMIAYSNRTARQSRRLEFLQQYQDVLINQYDLLCKRDIAIFQLIAGIGEFARSEDQQNDILQIQSEDTKNDV